MIIKDEKMFVIKRSCGHPYLKYCDGIFSYTEDLSEAKQFKSLHDLLTFVSKQPSIYCENKLTIVKIKEIVKIEEIDLGV